MVCVYCDSKTQVGNSRLQKRTNSVWRRRECKTCGAVFTTTEQVDLYKSLSIKHGKHLQPFSRDKLFLAVHDSVRHRKTAVDDATGLTDTIISKLSSHITDGCIQKSVLVHITQVALTRFDRTAATHYSAYHVV